MKLDQAFAIYTAFAYLAAAIISLCMITITGAILLRLFLPLYIRTSKHPIRRATAEDFLQALKAEFI